SDMTTKAVTQRVAPGLSASLGRYLSFVRKPRSVPPAATDEVPTPPVLSTAIGQMLVPDFITMPVGKVAESVTPPLAPAVTFSVDRETWEVGDVPATTCT